jgi:hypothetical protein
MKIGWTPKSIRTFKKLVRKNPQLRLLTHIPQIFRQI